MRSGNSAIIGSISHEVETYGPRLIQIGIALLRGYPCRLTITSATKWSPRRLWTPRLKPSQELRP